MADFKKIIGFTLKAEGGLSAEPRDSASGFPSPAKMKSGKHAGLPIHTNMGITYKTWTNYAKLKGFQPTGANFLAITPTQWYDVAYLLYWKPSFCDVIKSQGVAEIIFEARWGGGLNHMIGNLQSFLNKKGANLVVDRNIGINTANAINNFTGKSKKNEAELIKFLTDKRLEYLKSLKDWSWAGGGWSDRVNKLYNRAMSDLGEIAKPVGIGLGTFVIAGAIYYLYKKIS